MTTAEDRRLLIEELRRTDLEQVSSDIRAERELPKLRYHFTKHGAVLAAATTQDYLSRLWRHLEQPDLEFYAIGRGQGDIMWYAVDVDHQEVAQYNANVRRLWGYYLSRDFDQFLRLGKLVRIVFSELDGHWMVET